MKLIKAVKNVTAKRQKGFTLAEVLVSVGIVATLAATVAPTVFQHMKESRIAKAKSDAQAIADGIHRFRADVDAWPVSASGDDLLTRNHGLLFSEKGEWPKINLAQVVSCSSVGAMPGDGDPLVESGNDPLDPADDDVTITTSDLDLDQCDTLGNGNYLSWVPYTADTDTDGLLTELDGCNAASEGALRARIPAGSEFHSPASIDAYLIHNMPALSRLDDTDTALLAADGNGYISMVDTSSCGVVSPAHVDQAKIIPYKTGPGQAGWDGPYVADIPADPWGNKYLVNIHFAFAGSDHGFSPEAHENNKIMVLSAGPNGYIETPVGLHGDETGAVSHAEGATLAAGGDDVVYVFNLSKRTTM